jgi:hypothetical protein
LPGDLQQQQQVSQPIQAPLQKPLLDQLQQQKVVQQVQQEQQQRQRLHDQQLLLQPQLHRPAAAAARELAADLRAQHVVPGVGAAAAAFRVPVIPAVAPPAPFAVPVQAPSSPPAASGAFEHEIPFQDLQLGKLLGSGSFGDVYVCRIPVYLCAAVLAFLMSLQVQCRVVWQQCCG